MIKIVDVRIYLTTVVMMVEPTAEEWEKFYEEYQEYLTEDDYKCIMNDIKNPDKCNGCTTSLDKGDFCVFVRHKDYYGDIAHELFHVANKILCRCEVNHDADAEPWAYLIGWLTTEFYEMLKEETKEGVDG